MPNIISKIKTPDNSVYDIKPTSNANINTDGIFYITSGGSTSAITGSLTSLTSYYEGLKIVLNYTLLESSTSVTLNINSLGPKAIMRTSLLPLEEGLKTGGIYHLVYNGKEFVMDGYVNTGSSNTDYANPVFGDIGLTTAVSSLVAPLLARTSISANELVYYDVSLKGIATLSNALTSPYIFWDWGLAVCSSSYNLGDEIAANTLIQNGNILIESPSATGTLSSSHDVSLYVMFDANNQVIEPANIETNGYIYAPPFGLAGNTPKKGGLKTFIYIGTATGTTSHRGCQVHLDLSNHDFLTLSSESAVIPDPTTPVMTANPIFAINGRQVGGGNNTSGSYNNPVSGAGTNPAAAVNIIANDIVCYDSSVNGLVPLRAYMSGTPATSGIMYDWGLAFCTVAVSAGSTPPEGTLLQQITFTTTSAASEPVSIYAFFDSNGMPLQGFGPTPLMENQNIKLKPYAPLVPDNKALTMIYVGTWEGTKFHVDLSNHDFITYYNAPDASTSPSVSGTVDNTKLISHINGRPFYALMSSGGGGSASLDGQGYGICGSHTGGEVTPKDEGESSKAGDGEGEGAKTGDNDAWTGLVTLSGYEAVANSVVAVYFPSGQAPQRGGYLNINNEGAYPMLLKGNTINLGDIESESIIVFIFDGSAYNVVAGYNKGDYELTTRKVQTISSTSTSLQYPSARCIYNIVGNIEAALQAI